MAGGETGASEEEEAEIGVRILLLALRTGGITVGVLLDVGASEPFLEADDDDEEVVVVVEAGEESLELRRGSSDGALPTDLRTKDGDSAASLLSELRFSFLDKEVGDMGGRAVDEDCVFPPRVDDVVIVSGVVVVFGVAMFGVVAPLPLPRGEEITLARGRLGESLEAVMLESLS